MRTVRCCCNLKNINVASRRAVLSETLSSIVVLQHTEYPTTSVRQQLISQPPSAGNLLVANSVILYVYILRCACIHLIDPS